LLLDLSFSCSCINSSKADTFLFSPLSLSLSPLPAGILKGLAEGIEPGFDVDGSDRQRLIFICSSDSPL